MFAIKGYKLKSILYDRQIFNFLKVFQKSVLI